MKAEKNGTTVEAIQGNIVKQADLGAVVNAANAELRTGGGVAGAIHQAAGPELSEACREYAPIEPGEAVITPAFDLPNDYVIHCLGPVYGRDKPEAQLLESCYRKALGLAEENDVESIGFPALSTGAFGYPMQEATEVALEAVYDELPACQEVNLVRFVLFDEGALDVYVDVLEDDV